MQRLRPLKHLFFVLVLFSFLLLTGCRPKRSYQAPDGNVPFIPPTLMPTATPTLPPATPTPEVTPTSSRCTDILSYVNDLTIPDGTEVLPGNTMDKRWEVENTGTCNWDEKYSLKLISGPAMGVAEEQALYPARSKSRVSIRILFTAPEEPGIHQSAWQAYNSEGTPFGDPIYIEVVVLESPTNAPQ